MKKILSIFTSTIIVLISITSNANAVNTKDAIFKEIGLNCKKCVAEMIKFSHIREIKLV